MFPICPQAACRGTLLPIIKPIFRDLYATVQMYWRCNMCDWKLTE